ncbi:MAG: ATP-binding protein [Acidobacteria bacterium]|nr:ATP-binding protein [Acidobacteriota bacterium]
MTCPLCNDTRWKSVVTDGVEHVVRCDCWRDAVVARQLNEARVPQRYARCELSTFDHDMDSQREAYRRATAFVEAFPVVDRGLLLYGPHGVGKTHLAVGMLKAAIRTRGACGYFFETRELLRLVRDTYNRSVDETEMDVLAPVLKADLLVLDDLGAERTSEWVQETLGLVVNTRYNERRPTIFTSNLTDSPDSTDPRSFIFQLGARTRSRLLEMCDWVEIRGVDVREVGSQASPEAIHRWQKESPASPDNLRRASGLPPKSRNMARARLREPGAADLAWPGGRAGTKG